MKRLAKNQLYKTADVLDIGCGKEVPLAKTMYSSRYIPTTGSYTGIDVNVLRVPDLFSSGRFPIELIGQADVCVHDFGESTFRVITCFEVLEHVEPEHSFRMLKRIAALLEDEGEAYLSTPNYDPIMGPANNHVNEMTYKGLEFLIERAGLNIQKAYGTFASRKDYLHKLDPLQRELFDKLSDYYDSNYVATLFAPLYPEQSRNCLWHVTKGQRPSGVPDNLRYIAGDENSSSKEWRGFIMKQFGE
jgi:SAM-dependent methyltransferase